MTRKTRWGADYEKVFTPLSYTNIPDNIDIDTFELVIRRSRLDDINRRIGLGDYENADPDLRSPSPEPIYDKKTGQRLNTREVRTKEKYLKEKNSLIEELILLDKSYIPPIDYKPPKKSLKIYINEQDNQKHKLVELILGNRGQIQKELEKKSGCRISIRGVGSNWENKSYDKTYHDENDPLHVLIQADTEEQIRKAIMLIEPILDPFSQEHKLLKEKHRQAIAIQYGFNTETACEYCGERGHKNWGCPLKIASYDQANVKCDICGDKSHPTRDCPERVKPYENEPDTELGRTLKDINDHLVATQVPVLEPELKKGISEIVFC